VVSAADFSSTPFSRDTVIPADPSAGTNVSTAAGGDGQATQLCLASSTMTPQPSKRMVTTEQGHTTSRSRRKQFHGVAMHPRVFLPQGEHQVGRNQKLGPRPG
jgi:hypothetical protein